MIEGNEHTFLWQWQIKNKSGILLKPWSKLSRLHLSKTCINTSLTIWPPASFFGRLVSLQIETWQRSLPKRPLTNPCHKHTRILIVFVLLSQLVHTIRPSALHHSFLGGGEGLDLAAKLLYNANEASWCQAKHVIHVGSRNRFGSLKSHRVSSQ